MPLETHFTFRRSLAWRMTAQTTRAPFCFKDPLFCFTLPAWRPHLDDAVLLCVFREPARTANSILNECRQDYLAGVDMDFDRALRIWTLDPPPRVAEPERKRGQRPFCGTFCRRDP